MAPVGSVVFTEKVFPSVKLITFAWTSDVNGNVSGQPTTAARYSGQALQLVTVPGAGVSSYTVAIIDSNSLDLLCGQGTGRSTSNTEYLIKPGTAGALGSVSDDFLSITISGAGSAKTGTAYLWIR